MEPEGLLPHSQVPSTCQIIRGSCERFVTGYFLRRGVVNTSPNFQAGGPPLVGCPDCLFDIFEDTLLTLDRSFIRNLRTRHTVVNRDPLITERDCYVRELTKEGK
jgi:hypothetical protein